jgi:hypothetical protein
MNTETVTIVLPLPSPYLSPNKPVMSRGGRMRKAAIAAKFRRLAKEACLAQEIEGTWEKAIIHYAFYHSQNRRRDEANAIQSCKAMVDGCVDSKILADDDWKHLQTGRVTFEKDIENPRTELTLERVE